MNILVTKNLMLTRPLAFEHFENAIVRHIGWLNDPEVVRYSEQRHIKHTIESQKEYFSLFHETFHYFWDISYDQKSIGAITAFADTANSIAEVGILIGEKSLWGRGFGTEAWQAVCDWLLFGGTRKVEAGCMATNLGMQKIFEKTKMDFEGIQSDHFLCDCQQIDLVWYGRFK